MNKPKKNRSKKRRRNSPVSITGRAEIFFKSTKSPTELTGVFFDKENQGLSGVTKEGSHVNLLDLYSQTAYTGKTGKDKVLIRVGSQAIADPGDLARYLLTHYDVILAVDTNDRPINGEVVSVTVAIPCYLNIPAIGFLTTGRVGIFTLRGCPDLISPEKYGWLVVSDAVKAIPANATRRIALITDHDMENHASYNERKTAIIGNTFLPSNFTLLYARGDRNYHFLNTLVRECDKISSQVLTQLETSG